MMERATQPHILLSIAGFDPSSGAGTTADLQTFAAHGFYGLSAPTAITVQSTVGVTRVEAVSAGLLRDVLEQLEDDLPAAGVKIGMLGDAAVVDVVCDFLERVRGRREVVVVLDPVLRASSGAALLDEAGTGRLRNRLLPLCDVATPNQAEAAVLAGTDDLQSSVRGLRARCPRLHLVVTGGDAATPDDLVLHAEEDEPIRLLGERVLTTSTHGTGCAFSSALLCQMVGGEALGDAARGAKHYVEQALRTAPGLGRGKGPMNLLWPLQKKSSDPG